MPSVPIEATTLRAVLALSLPALNLVTEDPLKDFFNFSISNFLQLLRRCINMIVGECSFLKLGCPMLISYLDNIERIGGSRRATSYQARLEALEKQVQVLNMLHKAGMAAIIEIEVARL